MAAFIAVALVAGASKQALDAKRAAQEAAQEAEKQAGIGQSRRLANQATVLLQKGKLDRALLAATEAYRSAPTFEARDALLAGVHVPHLRSFLHGPARSQPELAMSGDGKVLIVRHKSADLHNQGMLLWDLETGRPTLSLPESVRNLPPGRVTIGPAGNLVAMEGYGNLVV